MADEKKDRRQEKLDAIQALADSGRSFVRTKSGDDWEMEILTDFMLVQSRKGVTSHSELRDFLSISQLDLRRSREVVPTSGFPEAHLFSGLYRRAYNPNSRGSRTSSAPPNLDGEHDG